VSGGQSVIVVVVVTVVEICVWEHVVQRRGSKRDETVLTAGDPARRVRRGLPWVCRGGTHHRWVR